MDNDIQKVSEDVSTKKLYKLAYAHMLVIALFALLAAAMIVSIANDMYAFVKPNETIYLTVERPLPLEDMARELDKAGVVKNPHIFSMYVKHKNKKELLECFRGEIELNSSMSYREILISFSTQ